MSTGSTIALFAISSLSLLASAATLTVVLVGAKRVEAQIEETKSKSNDALKKLKAAVNSLEL